MVIQELIITVYQPGVSMKASVKYQLLLQFFFISFIKNKKTTFKESIWYSLDSALFSIKFISRL